LRIDIKSETQAAAEASGEMPITTGDSGYAEGKWIPNDATGEMEWHAVDGSVMSEKEWAGGGKAPAAVEPEAAAPVENEAAE
jgi:N utilization substance protein A